MIGRFIAGETVNDETIGVDVINEVGPIPGHFLNTAHTRRWWRLEQFMPRAADRLTYPEWVARGKKTALDYARERLDDILSSHEPEPLTASQEEDIERILADARTYYRKQGLL
jgi:trimethylamine--corrinoid protein Co-methyltransferase